MYFNPLDIKNIIYPRASGLIAYMPGHGDGGGYGPDRPYGGNPPRPAQQKIKLINKESLRKELKK